MMVLVGPQSQYKINKSLAAFRIRVSPFGLLFALSLLCSLAGGHSLMMKDHLENLVRLVRNCLKDGDMISIDIEF